MGASHCWCALIAVPYILSATTVQKPSLNLMYVQDGQLDHNLDRMRYACMDLLMQLPRSFKTKKLGTTFLINNFNHVAVVSNRVNRAWHESQ